MTIRRALLVGALAAASLSAGPIHAMNQEAPKRALHDKGAPAKTTDDEEKAERALPEGVGARIGVAEHKEPVKESPKAE